MREPWHCVGMVLKLDPRYPLVWRTPTTLQVGVSRPIAVLSDMSLATERMVAALVSGVSRSGLTMIGTTSGATPGDVESLVAALQPAFVVGPQGELAQKVLVAGSGPTALRISDALAWSGIRVAMAADEAAAVREDCSFALIVAQFVVPPNFHGTWLRRDIPHLSVAIGDSEVEIGPAIDPGRGPCLYCQQLHRTDADPAWPAIATQLHGRRSAADTPLVASEVAAIAARAVLAFLRKRDSQASGTSDSPPDTTSTILSTETGEIRASEWRAHPGCGCRGLQVSAAAQPGTGSAAAGPRAVVTLHPRTTTASSAPG